MSTFQPNLSIIPSIAIDIVKTTNKGPDIQI
jgi:hypothetical protein